jgi:hypothetical protein
MRQIIQLLNFQIVKFQNCQIAKFQNCQIAKLPNCQIVKLPNFQIVKLSLTTVYTTKSAPKIGPPLLLKIIQRPGCLADKRPALKEQNAPK